MKKKISLDEVEKEMLSRINNEKSDMDDNYNKNNNFEIVLIFIIISLIFSLFGFFIGQSKNDYNQPLSINKNLNKFIEEYNYILNNYYGDVQEEKLIKSAIDGMLSSLDNYSQFFGEEDDNQNILLKGSYYGLGIGIILNKDNKLVISKVYDNSSAYKSGLMVGDIINKINSILVESKDLNDIKKNINQSEEIEIEILRNDESKIFKLHKETINLQSVNLKINDDIAYINIDIFAENTDEQFADAIKEVENKSLDKIIIDLRNNSGGHLTTVENIISEFLDEKHVIFQTEDKNGIEKIYSKGKKNRNFKIVILQNNLSASASEVMTTSLKENLNAYIIGTKSFGKGTVQGVQNIEGLGKYKMTTKKWLTSQGKWIEKKGIEPDLNIELSKDFYKNPLEENDNQLQEAIKYFDK